MTAWSAKLHETALTEECSTSKSQRNEMENESTHKANALKFVGEYRQRKNLFGAENGVAAIAVAAAAAVAVAATVVLATMQTRAGRELAWARGPTLRSRKGEGACDP